MKAKVRTRVMAKAAVLAAAAFLVFALAGCSLVKEGVTGEKSAEGQEEIDREEAAPAMPAAFNIVGDWFGVYAGSEYLAFRFTADGKCEMQSALYPSDMFGPRYFGDYTWGGEGGKEVLLDLYRGVSSEVDYGDGSLWDEWSDGGRDSATIALTMAFRIYGGDMRSFALKARGAGTDTEGYLVVQDNAFLVVLESPGGGNGNPSPFLYGSTPYDNTEGKEMEPSAPDSFVDRVERFYTTDELNVRCGPSTDFGTYGTVMPGTPVDKIGYASGNDDWAFVLLADGGGWVNTGYLTETPPGAAPQETPADDE